MTSRAATRSTSPWTARGTVAVAAAIAVGAALVVAAGVVAARRATLDDEVVWLNTAAAGVILAGAAEVMWLVGGRHRVSRLRDQVVEAYREPAPVVTAPVVGGRVTVRGSTWSHRPDCLLVAGKELVAAADGMDVCVVCANGEARVGR